MTEEYPTLFAITEDVLDLDDLLARITLPSTGAACFFTGMVRGVTSRGMLDGGAQERALSGKYRQWARACALDWPKPAALLERVAKDYETEARYHDDRAERRDWS